MSDDRKITGPADSSRINMGEDCEVYYWTAKFGVSKGQLQAAVDVVGSSAEKVAAQLAKARS